jgi:hypothetical protein
MTLAFLRLQTLVALGFDTVKLGPNYRLGYGPVGICGIFGRTFVASRKTKIVRSILDGSVEPYSVLRKLYQP